MNKGFFFLVLFYLALHMYPRGLQHTKNKPLLLLVYTVECEVYKKYASFQLALNEISH